MDEAPAIDQLQEYWNQNSMMKVPENPDRHRARFEKWISAMPYERSVDRFSDDESKAAWPGQYRDIQTQIAWRAWCEAVKPHDT